MRLLPKSIHRCRRYPTKFNSGRDIPLITGEEDLRTPVTQAEQFYRALKFLKVPTALLRYKDQAHGTGSRPSNFMRTQLYLRYWFDKYKRPSGRATNHQG